MKRILLCIVILFMVNITIGQIVNYDIKLPGGTLTPQPNVGKNMKRGPISDAYLYQGFYYVLIQFYNLPTTEEMTKLKTDGIRFFSFLPNNAYWAAIPAENYKEKINDPNIRSVVGVESELKVVEKIKNKDIPEYALGDKNEAKIIIHLFPNLISEQILQEIKDLGGKIIGDHKKFNMIEAQIKTDKISGLSIKPYIRGIGLTSQPSVLYNLPGKTSHQSNMLENLLGLTGNGIIAGIWDGNIDKHFDFDTRMHVMEREYNGITDHGIHTSGTIMGSGALYPMTRGMAPKTNLYAWNFNTQSNNKWEAEEMDITAYYYGMSITSNSYGISYNPNWFPFPYYEKEYLLDLLTQYYPHLTHVFSAGNSGDYGYGTTPKCAKNPIVVGAIDSYDQVAYFSSRGPVFDGRIKPEISAVGVRVASTSYPDGYVGMSGTSMACPGVAGTIAQLQELYMNEISEGEMPPASLMKAIVCNTARDLGNTGPDYTFGFGAINAYPAAKILLNQNGGYEISSVGTDDIYSKTITVPAGTAKFKVMIVWTDPPAELYTPGPALINDLNLTVENEDQTWSPWILDPSDPELNATTGEDNLNPIEQITINNPAIGNYTIKVKGKSVPVGFPDQNILKQEFSVVYYFAKTDITVTYPSGDEKFNPGEKQIISWLGNGGSDEDNYIVSYSKDNGSTWTVLSNEVLANLRYYEWTVPGDITNTAKIKVEKAGLTTGISETFTVFGTPAGLMASNFCGDINTLSWNQVTGATSYDVLKLDRYSQNISTIASNVLTTSYTVAGLTAGPNNYYTVVANGANGIKGNRARAINLGPLSSVSNYPFAENFETGGRTDYFKLSASQNSSAQIVCLGANHFLRFTGSTTNEGWTGNTANDAWTNNISHVASAKTCAINPNGNQNLYLKFKLKQTGSSIQTSWFRLLVNNNPVANVNGKTNFNPTTLYNDQFKEVIYDLSPYCGTPFTLEFQASCEFNDLLGTSADVVDIDNIEIITPYQVDAGLVSILEPQSGFKSDNEQVKVIVKNFGLKPLTAIPIVFEINGNKITTEYVSKTLNVGETYVHTFSSRAIIPANAKEVTIKAYAQYFGDLYPANDAQIITITRDLHCIAGAGGDEYIYKVKTGSIDNNTGFSPGGYGDYTNLSTDMTIGKSYPIEVYNRWPYTGDKCGIWVDWNDNGEFLDETPIQITQDEENPRLYKADIIPPVETKAGPKRMRVRIDYQQIGPCSNSLYGEVEDYSINVISIPPEIKTFFIQKMYNPGLKEAPVVQLFGKIMNIKFVIGTDITYLIPSFTLSDYCDLYIRTLSGELVKQTSNKSPVNFENMVQYVLMTKNGETAEYFVNVQFVENQMTAIDKKSESLNINLYPNPTNAKFTLTNVNKSQISVFDISGRLVKNVICESDNFTIDLAGKQSGTYFIKITKEDMTITKKLELIK